jgi:hypothetical protein
LSSWILTHDECKTAGEKQLADLHNCDCMQWDTQESFFELVWEGIILEEHNLNKLILNLNGYFVFVLF